MTEGKAATAAEVNEAIAGGTAPADLEADAAFYCPGCGTRYDAKGSCSGTAEQPHQATELASTKELAGDADKHTPAQPSE